MPSTPYTYTSPDDPAREDEGLFGPGSMTWRVMSNRIMWVAVVRALYLQALHPRVIRGTLQNAATITEPADTWARLRRTRKFIETRTFGTTAEADRAGRRVRRIHDSLTGTDLDGTGYRVDEPELLLWVHCGEVASCADIAQRSRLPFSAADLDAFVDEQRASADLIGLDRAAAPASMAELGTYYEEIRPRLYACDEARQALRLTLHPPVPDGNRVLKLGLPPVAALAFGTLPGWARRMYGRPGGPLSDMAATAGLRATRLALSQERLFLGAMRAIHRAESATETGRPEHGRQALGEAHLDVEAASGADDGQPEAISAAVLDPLAVESLERRSTSAGATGLPVLLTDTSALSTRFAPGFRPGSGPRGRGPASWRSRTFLPNGPWLSGPSTRSRSPRWPRTVRLWHRLRRRHARAYDDPRNRLHRKDAT